MSRPLVGGLLGWWCEWVQREEKKKKGKGKEWKGNEKGMGQHGVHLILRRGGRKQNTRNTAECSEDDIGIDIDLSKERDT